MTNKFNCFSEENEDAQRLKNTSQYNVTISNFLGAFGWRQIRTKTFKL